MIEPRTRKGPSPIANEVRGNPPAHIETVEIRIDGKAYRVPKTMPDPLTGRPLPTTMIQACMLHGIDVPHYCYHPKLPVAGNCRMCLVEYGMPVQGPDRKPRLGPDGSPQIRRMTLPYEPQTPRGTIACATPIAPGMEIYPSSEATKKMREAVLESLLINHPLDCPICDQAGECGLQEYSLQYGQARGRFVETKVHKPKQVDLGPRIMLDDERCILCSRCIRFTRDIVGDDALGFTHRGSHTTLTHYPGKPFDNNYTLNTVDLCPVGALTSKDFRFQMRVWFLKETKGLCASCGTGCNIVIGSRENRVFRFEPRQNDAVNACWLCDAGRLNYPWIRRADRLSSLPGGVSGRLGWKATLERIAAQLRTLEPGALAVIGSARQTNEELYLLKKIADRFHALRDSIPREGEGDALLVAEDKNPNSNGARVIGFCYTEMGINLPKIADGIREGTIKALMVFGEDVTRHGIEASHLEKLEQLVVCDVLPNPTTESAPNLLPGCAPVEKRGSFVNIEGRLQRFFKAVEPPGDARPELEILLDLARYLDIEIAGETIEGVFDQMARETAAFQGIRWADLGDQGVDVPI